MTCHDPRLDRDPYMAEAERNLWVAVLADGLRDALGFGTWQSGRQRDLARQRRPQCAPLRVSQARNWIGTADFAEVCHLAGRDPASAAACMRARIAAADAGELTADDLGLWSRHPAHGLKGPRPGRVLPGGKP